MFITREKVFFSALNRISELGLTSVVPTLVGAQLRTKNSILLIVIKTTVFYILKKMHHIYLYEVEKSVLISRLLKVIKNRSPFNIVYDKKMVQTRASNGVFYTKTFAKNF